MEIKGQCYREGGQWKIVLQVEAWVLDDVLRDVTNNTRAIITVFDLDFPLVPYPNGVSIYRMSPPDKTHLLGTVLFEEELNKKAEY